jgi:hypothetical protein
MMRISTIFTMLYRLFPKPGAFSYRQTFNLTARVIAVSLSGFVLLNAAAVQAVAGIEGQALVDALRRGGYQIYFRHAASDWSQYDQVTKAGDWTSCDPGKMRQISESGRKTAAAIGDALRTLGIPIGQVLASPYCRTVETARIIWNLHICRANIATGVDPTGRRVQQSLKDIKGHRYHRRVGTVGTSRCGL